MSVISRSLLFLIAIALLITTVSAYIITINGPDKVTSGSPLVITGNTSFPEDTYFDIVLFYSKYTAGEIKRQKIIVDQSKQFRAEFETRDLKRGQYKIEVHNIVSDGKEFVESALGSSSITRRVITLIDRSDEIAIESSNSQKISSALTVTGRVKNMGNGVVTLRAFGPDNFTFGPQQLITKPGFADKDGHFSTLIPVTGTGEYQVSFSDKNGFIGEVMFNVTNEDGTTGTPIPTMTPVVIDTSTPLPTPTTTATTPIPTTTKSPLPGFLVMAGIIVAFVLQKRV
jgi:hypothetical protein